MNVFLDLDGTLLDPFKGILQSVAHALELSGVPVPPLESLGWVIGPPMLENLSRLGVPDPNAALDAYRERYADTGLFEATPYPGMLDALADMHARGNRLVLMTSKPRVYAERITEEFGISQFLNAQFGPELDGTFNDKSALLAHAIDKLAVDRSRSAMVGDRIFDIRAGKSNQVTTIAATWGYGSNDETDQADYSIADITQLPALIDRLSDR